MKLPIIKTLRVKVVLLALLPIALVMVVVSVIAYTAIINSAREVAERRDTELARLAASRLSENLHHYVRTLQSLSASDACRSLEPQQIDAMFAASKSWLYLFDGGVFVYSRDGTQVWASPFAARQHLRRFPLPELFDRLENSLRPVFSNIFSHDAVNEEVILIGVPIIDAAGEFVGALAGFCSVRFSLLGTVYARVLEFESGRKGYAFLVDGNGRVLYHRHTSLLATLLDASEPVARVTRGETGATLTSRPSGERLISGFAPVPDTAWGIITQEEWSVVSAPIFDYLKLFWGMLWLGGLISAGLVFFFIRRILQPIDTLIRGTRQVADGNFTPITVPTSGDEIEALGRQFNAMASALSASFSKRTRELEAAQEELIKHEKLSVLGQLTATVSHELRNPLGVIRSSIYFLERKQPNADPKIRQHLARIEAQVELCDTIVNDLLDYARTRQPEPVFTEITPFLESLVEEIALPDDIHLRCDFEADIPIVPFDRIKLRGAITNLVENAVTAVQAKQTEKETPPDYQAEISFTARASRRGVRLTVRDNGVGMSPETAAQAFEPLFTTRARGVGLGLAIVRKIAEEHHGGVTLDSRSGEGTVIELEIARWGHFNAAAAASHPSTPSVTQEKDG
ncbi:MAG: sensor histidine kinase [Desulfosarcinaceae bacterium]|nr:sensor histidine kinase [Desulfosarcinaceae bacterium]